MSRNATIAVIAAVIAFVVVGGWYAFRNLNQVSEAEYAANFEKGCQGAARESYIQAGKAPADAQTAAVAYCTCALDVVKQLPMSERRELDKGGGEGAQKIALDIRAKCLK